METIRHMKYPVIMDLFDPFDNISDLIIKDLTQNGWKNWVVKYDNPNQLELFKEGDIYD
jgi:hypothetical protein